MQDYDDARARVRSALGDAVVDRLQMEAQSLTIDAVVGEAIAVFSSVVTT